jgi:hypothetical protein
MSVPTPAEIEGSAVGTLGTRLVPTSGKIEVATVAKGLLIVTGEGEDCPPLPPLPACATRAFLADCA